MTVTDVIIPYAAYKEADDLNKLVLEKTQVIEEAAFEIGRASCRERV